MDRAEQLIRALRLTRHPERGYYAETYRSKTEVVGAGGAARSASTAIYFLLTDADRATYLHRLKSDELFHFYEGGPLDVLMLHPDGSH